MAYRRDGKKRKKLTLLIKSTSADRGAKYAVKNGTSVSDLVEKFLDSLKLKGSKA